MVNLLRYNPCKNYAFHTEFGKRRKESLYGIYASQLLGCGGLGTHMPTSITNIQQHHWSLCAIWSRERANESAQRLGVKAYYSVPSLLENEVLDAVSVATGGFENGGAHFEPTMQALEAGLHVLCEKPLSNDVARAREMVNKAKEKDVCLGTNLNHRFTPLAKQAKEWVTNGKLGDFTLHQHGTVDRKSE